MYSISLLHNNWVKTFPRQRIIVGDVFFCAVNVVQKVSDKFFKERLVTDVELKVLTPVVIQSSIFSDVTYRNSLKVNRIFGGTNCLHLQSRISRTKYSA
jgi:hypothetical protein